MHKTVSIATWHEISNSDTIPCDGPTHINQCRDCVKTFSCFLSRTANIGGLLALCLGASLVTCVEVVDVAIQTLCRSLGSRKSRKFADTSNHVLFRPVDILDDGVATAGLRQPHVVKVPLPASIPKVKIDATYRGKHVQHQAETDI